MAAFADNFGGRQIPNFFILEINVVRFKPSWAAAPLGPPIAHSVLSRACKMMARCESMNVAGMAGLSTGIETAELVAICCARSRDKGLDRTPL